LGSGTTAGNSVVVMIFCAAGLTAPSGFTADAGAGAGAIMWYRKGSESLTAGETSWTFTTGANNDSIWYVFEASNIDSPEPLDVTANSSSGSLASGGTLSSGTTAQNIGLSVIALAGFSTARAAGATITWDGYTNGFEEVADLSSTARSMAVARLFHEGTTRTFSSTATVTRSDAANAANSRVVVYRAADAPVAAPLAGFTTFGWGTHAGMGNTGSSNPQGNLTAPSGTWGTNYLVSSSYARSGYADYGLRIVDLGSVTLPGFTATAAAWGFHVRPISGSGVCVAGYFNTAAGATTSPQLVYNFSTNKWGLRWGNTGTPSYQSGTTALNTWAWIDGAERGMTTSTYKAVWRLETGTDIYTDQTPPADLTGQSSNFAVELVLGTPSSQTATFEYCVPVWGKYYAAYPIGPHKGQTLTVDPAGTPSISGTSSNFSVFTANGTLAAWNATNARDALDDLPPTISASADGVVQTAVAASDYAEFPMANPTVASDEVIAAIRSVCAMYGGTGTGTGTLGLKVHDGTTETVIDSGVTAYDADSLTTPSATYPVWRRGTVTAPSTGWTVSRANSLVTRMGYSSDATPDMGAHALYLEVATRKAAISRALTVEDGAMTADLYVNPYSSAAVSYVITNNDPTRTAVFSYSIAGTPQTPVTVAPGAGPTALTLNADAFGDISETTLTA